jgi:hypothetical protein
MFLTLFAYHLFIWRQFEVLQRSQIVGNFYFPIVEHVNNDITPFFKPKLLCIFQLTLVRAPYKI